MVAASGWRRVQVGAMLICGLGVACRPQAPSNSATAAAATKPTRGASTPGSPVSALRSKLFRYRFALYLDRQPAGLSAALSDLAKQHGMTVVAEPAQPDWPALASTISMIEPPIKDFAPPAEAKLEYFSKGLNADEKKRLVAARYVAVFEVVGPGRRAFDDYHSALLMGRELGQRFGALLWDEEMRTAFSIESWQSRLDSWQGGLPFINRHVVLHEYRDGDLLRIVSLGMAKLGLPDVAVNDVTSVNDEHMGKLVDLVLQRLAEGATPDPQGRLQLALDQVEHAAAKAWLSEDVTKDAKREVVVRLVPTSPEEGDADNRLFELKFSSDPAHRQEEQAKVASELFGSVDTVVYVEHDAALLAASARARQKAFKLRARFANGPPFGEQLVVKSPFKTASKGTEWMWIEVVKWQGDVITGIVTEDAFDVPGLKAGARVDVKAGEIFDYALVKRDGTHEGNETEPLIEARERGRDTK